MSVSRRGGTNSKGVANTKSYRVERVAMTGSSSCVLSIVPWSLVLLDAKRLFLVSCWMNEPGLIRWEGLAVSDALKRVMCLTRQWSFE